MNGSCSLRYWKKWLGVFKEFYGSELSPGDFCSRTGRLPGAFRRWHEEIYGAPFSGETDPGTGLFREPEARRRPSRQPDPYRMASVPGGGSAKHDWKAVLREISASGLTAYGFCGRHGIAYTSLKSWCARHGVRIPCAGKPVRSVRDISLLPVEVVHGGKRRPAVREAPGGDSGVSIRAGGVCVRLRRGFDRETLGRVVEVLRGASC